MRFPALLLILVLLMQAGQLFGVAGPRAEDYSSGEFSSDQVEESPLEASDAEMETRSHESPMREIGPAGLLSLAQSLASQGESAEAMNTYKLLIDRFPDSDKRNVAYYEIGLLLYKSTRVFEARSYLERVSSSWWVEPKLREKTRVLLREIDSILDRGTASGELPAIGLILPLKGRYSSYGEAALKGVLMAADVFGSGDMQTRAVDVFVRDVSGSPAEGSRAVTELAGNERVAGIVGPLLNSTAYQSASRAEAIGIPLITLSQKEDIAGAGEYVFRNSLAPRAQARAVAEYALTVLGKSRFAVLYPHTHAGRAMAEAFINTVTGSGGEVTAINSYVEGTKDFGEIMRSLFQIETDEVKEGRRIITEYFPAASVDALYIPDSYRTVSLVSPYIKYYNIDDVQLLGSSGWNSTHLVELAGRAVEGAVFVDGFFPKSRRGSSTEFARRFKETYGKDAGEVEAEAYDAASLLIKAIDPEMPGRDLVRERLLQMSGYEGAEGPVHFDRYGGAVKEPFILTVKGRSIVEAAGYEPVLEDEPALDSEPVLESEPVLDEPGEVDDIY
ncbi:MAG: penicillin-binding protein activator [Thermodesulfobacteriota bacterium]